MGDDWETTVRQRFANVSKKDIGQHNDPDAWLASVRLLAEKHHFDFYAERTASGFELGFPTSWDFSAFVVLTQGDCEGNLNNTEKVILNSDVDPHQWAAAASDLLRHLQINHDYDFDGQSPVFRFHCSSHQILFHELAQTSVVNTLSEAIVFRDLVEKLKAQQKPSDNSFQPGP